MAGAVRYLIEGELQLLTPLHLGSGESTTREGLEVEELAGKRLAEVSAVVTDHQGRAYLPGRALKGALRSWLAGVPGLSSDLVAQVLGSEEVLARESRGEAKVFGGKAELWNAFVRELPAFGAEPPYWLESRATAVRASVALDRRTRTVAGDRLFFEEFVPPGTSFELRVSGQGLTEEDLNLLLFALDGFNHEARPVSLGAGGTDGYGRFTWRLTTLRELRPERVKAWLAQSQTAAGYEGLFEVAPEELAKIRSRALGGWTRPQPNELAVKLAITFDAPFLVAAPRRKTEQQEGTGEPDHVPVTDSAGWPLLPASSLRGALRHRAEKILRTLGVRACRPESPDAACKPVTELEEVRRLCPACRLFGAPGWGTLLAVPDFEQVESQPARRQDFEHVAIDRFTGGVSGSLKFNTRAFVGAKLGGTVRLDLSRQSEPWMQGLLALVLRDLAEGDLPLGFGSAKGYGACHAEVTEVTGPGFDWEGAATPDAALRAKLVEALQSFHDFVALHAQPVAPAKCAPLPEAAAPAAPMPAPGKVEADAFHNPYHFVPLGPAMDDPERLSAQDFTAGRLEALSHDRFQVGKGFYSGRLVFRLKTETPTVVGAQHDRANASEPAVVTPFELEGQPALPGASLRGMISSLAEAATGSAMRVLHDRSLSYRAQMKDSLPALGRLVKDEQGKVWLEPLALPAFACDAAGRAFQPVAKAWKDLFPDPLLRVYVNGYRGLGKEGVKLVPGSFLERVEPGSASSENPDELWYFPLGALPAWDGDGRPTMPKPHVKTTTDRKGNQSHQVVAQDRDPAVALPPGQRAEPIPRKTYEALDAASRSQYVPGRLRVLDIEGHEKEIPSQRKHEIFLPLADPAKTWPRLEVAEAIAEFHRLADERADAEEYLPFSLKGKSRDREKERTNLVRLKAGDVVFFKPDPSGQRAEAVALSSIWRKGAGTVFDYVPSELRPFHPKRENVSIAERLFGFVEQGLREAEKQEAALGLAGRVRFGFGRLESGQEEPYVVPEPVPIAILGSPKPPAPALYFRNGNGSDTAIAKSRLRPEQHEPQGRKVYLHQPPSECWRFQGQATDRVNLRSKAKPLREHLRFLVHLDFDNLTERELALLLYALRPTEPFRHLLGMGKPLGLGRVEVSPLGLFLVDRRKRYGEEMDLLAAPRYHRATVPAALGAEVEKGYPREAAAAGAAAGPTFADLVGRFRAAMPAELRWAIELVGDPASVAPGVSVTYPRTGDPAVGDEKGYEWFVRNQDERHYEGQQLQPIAAFSGLPVLKRSHKQRDQGGGGGGEGQRRGGSRPQGSRSEGQAPSRAGPRTPSREKPGGSATGAVPEVPSTPAPPGRFGSVLAEKLGKLRDKG